VLRGDEILTLTVRGSPNHFAVQAKPTPSSSHELLDNNIGLINPARLSEGSVPAIMEQFAGTDGLIIDLRQYPSWIIFHEMAEYLVGDRQLFAISTQPSQIIPGVYVELFTDYSGGMGNTEAYLYTKNVVLLMDESSISLPEYTVMSLRNGANVTVIGSNSIGADGDVTRLPLPGGIIMTYTGLGVYTPEGGQTQRIGISPDIYVERTIAGVREGRDELMEAAMEFLLRG